MSRSRLALSSVLLLSLGGCGLVAFAIVVPLRILAGILSFGFAVSIGSEGLSPQEELWAGGIQIDRHLVEVQLQVDGTYEATSELSRTVTSTAGLGAAQRSSVTFDPRSQELELLWAEVLNPDGTRIPVGADRVFTRPSAAAQDTPGFVSSETTTVLFPQLRVGSKTLVRWRFRERGQSTLGFNYVWRAPFAYPVTDATVRITYPADVPLRFASRGGFEVAERQSGSARVVEATIRGYEGQTPERAMVDPLDVCPLFVVTTLSSWEEIGAQFHAAVVDRVEVTPEIAERAARIVGGKTGLEAARAIHRWVAGNVQYVAVYLSQMDAWVPHRAGEVLANGYGDCKDQYVLLASLLRARGIECTPALTRLGRSFETLPIQSPLQFDHCIAYLPEFDVYSDPTDPFRDLGELDVPVSGRMVVLGTPEGRVARTPAGESAENVYRVHHEVALDRSGKLSGHSSITASGRPSGRLRRMFALAASPDQAADSLLQEAPEAARGALTTTDPTDLAVPLRAEGDWQSDLPIAMGDTLHFPIPAGIDLANPATVRGFVSAEERNFPVVIAAVEIVWTYDVRLPEGYRFAGRLPEVRLENEAASFETRSRLEANDRLRIERTVRIKRDRFEPEEYGALREVLIAAASSARGILVAERR